MVVRVVLSLVMRPVVAQAANFRLEIGETVEIAIDAGESEVRDFVELSQWLQNREPDLLARDLRTPRGSELLFHLLREPSQRIFIDTATLARLANARNDLLATERFSDPGPLDYGESQLLHRREPPITRRALTTPPDGRTIIGSSAVDNTAIGVPTERTVHCRRPPLCQMMATGMKLCTPGVYA